MTSPTQRTLEWCREHDWLADVVEQNVPHCNVKRDLWGFVDILAIDPAGVLYGLQVTDGSHHANRRDKILASPALPAWCQHGRVVELWSWSLAGARGTRKHWTLRRERIE